MAVTDDVVALLVKAYPTWAINVNLFIGSGAVLPTTAVYPITDLTLGMGPYMSIAQTGGFAPTRVQNQQGPNTRRPSFQLFVRAKSPTAARTMIEAAVAALDGTYNLAVNGVYYYRIVAKQDPEDLGQSAGYAEFVCNFDTERNPSP